MRKNNGLQLRIIDTVVIIRKKMKKINKNNQYYLSYPDFNHPMDMNYLVKLNFFIVNHY